MKKWRVGPARLRRRRQIHSFETPLSLHRRIRRSGADRQWRQKGRRHRRPHNRRPDRIQLIGIIVGAVYQNHTYAILMSAYGGGSSIYRNFIARRREIVFPKNTAMDIGFGNRTMLPMPAAGQTRHESAIRLTKRMGEVAAAQETAAERPPFAKSSLSCRLTGRATHSPVRPLSLDL